MNNENGPAFQITLLKELADMKQELLATQGQLGTANRMVANAVKRMEEWEAAPQVPMTDEDIDRLWDAHNDAPAMDYRYLVTRAIEAHHKIGLMTTYFMKVQ